DAVQQEIDTQVSVTKTFNSTRQEIKAEIDKVVDKKRAEAVAIRKATVKNGHNGYDTKKSLALEKEATDLSKKGMYIDMLAGLLYGGSNSDALAYMGTATQSDLVRKAAKAPEQIWLVKCGQDSHYCSHQGVGDKRQIFDVNELTPEQKENIVVVSNPGIFNPLKDALKNAIKQNKEAVDKSGIVVVNNPETGNDFAELLYAAYDKLNDITGAHLPLSNAEKANIKLFTAAKEKGYELDTNSHSRGGLTTSVSLQAVNNAGLKQVPIRKSIFYGTATNVEAYANQLVKNGYISTDGEVSHAYSAVHQSDFVGYLIGGNNTMGGHCSWCYSHSSYSAEIPSKYLKNNQGQYVDKNDKVVKPNNKVKNPEYNKFIHIWGDLKNGINPSQPVLILPTMTIKPTGVEDEDRQNPY
ncbi:MAG: hemagglutinin repeat-containing protein, partial [Ostreibacterium sp.]